MIEVIKYNSEFIPPYEVVSVIDDGSSHLTRVWNESPSKPSKPTEESLKEWALATSEALKRAMGGWSQVTEAITASAVTGHLNNGGLGCCGTLAQIAEALCLAIDGPRTESLLDPSRVLDIVRGQLLVDPRYGMDAYPLPGYYA